MGRIKMNPPTPDLTTTPATGDLSPSTPPKDRSALVAIALAATIGPSTPFGKFLSKLDALTAGTAVTVADVNGNHRTVDPVAVAEAIAPFKDETPTIFNLNAVVPGIGYTDAVSRSTLDALHAVVGDPDYLTKIPAATGYGPTVTMTDLSGANRKFSVGVLRVALARPGATLLLPPVGGRTPVLNLDTGILEVGCQKQPLDWWHANVARQIAENYSVSSLSEYGYAFLGDSFGQQIVLAALDEKVAEWQAANPSTPTEPAK